MRGELWSVSRLLEAADASLKEGGSAAARVWPTGFGLLDTYLSGGLRSGDLTLLGGPQGMGKTTLVLQMVRNSVRAGNAAVYFSYEHDPETILERLIAIEAGEGLGVEALPLRRIRDALEAKDGHRGNLEERLSSAPGGAAAVRAVAGYADRVLVHRSTGNATGIEEIRDVIEQTAAETGQTPLVVVDYLQKVATSPDAPLEEERVTRIVEGLKDLALELEVAVLAVVAADMEGLVAGRRLKVHHLRGSSALAYEADVILVMNEKYDVVARHHLVYNVSSAEAYKNWAVVSIEKNRRGLDKIDLELRKRFEQGRFEATAQLVAEQLVDERVFRE